MQAVPLPELVSLLTRAGSLSLVAVGEACSRLVTQADLGQLSPLQSPAALNLLRGYVAAGVRPAQNLLDVVAPAAPAPASKPSLFASFLSQASSKPAHSAVPVPTLVLPHTLPADDHTAATDGGDPMSVEPSAHPSSTAAAVVAVTAVDREEVMRTPPVPRLESLSASGLGHALRDALSDPVEVRLWNEMSIQRVL